MIKNNALDEAIVEALRFVKAAKAYRAVSKEHGGRQVVCPEHASALRASLDLSRKLVEVRS